jgi:uncharacterized protein (TIGR01777 family)
MAGVREAIRNMANAALRRVVLAGGSGQVGTLLARHFHSQGAAVVVLSRAKRPAPWRVVAWDGARHGVWARELDGADLLVNLAGRSVNCRYHAANRSEILGSRIRSTQVLREAITQLGQPPPVWMNASTATIYRHALDRAMDEETGELGGREPDAPDTWKFSIDVARRWEEAFFARDLPGTRRIALRSAMVMSPDHGGIFDTLLRLVRFALGGASGDGRQFVSWIHDTDFVRAIDHLVVNSNMSGCVNLAAPGPLPNTRFMGILRDAWGARIGLPATKWMLEVGAILLRTETELVLKSRRVMPARLLQDGFRFQYPEWPAAAQDLVTRWRSRVDPSKPSPAEKPYALSAAKT